jgi:hypothetical protein
MLALNFWHKKRCPFSLLTLKKITQWFITDKAGMGYSHKNHNKYFFKVLTTNPKNVGDLPQISSINPPNSITT